MVRPLVAIGVNDHGTRKKIPKEVTFHHTSPSGPKSAGPGGPALPGRVPPPGEPVKVGRTVETKRDVPAFLGLHVLVSFACALGESALPFMGSAGRGGPALPGVGEEEEKRKSPALPLPPTTDNRQPTSFLRHAVGDKSAGRCGPALPSILNSGGRDDHPP